MQHAGFSRVLVTFSLMWVATTKPLTWAQSDSGGGIPQAHAPLQANFAKNDEQRLARVATRRRSGQPFGPAVRKPSDKRSGKLLERSALLAGQGFRVDCVLGRGDCRLFRKRQLDFEADSGKLCTDEQDRYQFRCVFAGRTEAPDHSCGARCAAMTIFPRPDC